MNTHSAILHAADDLFYRHGFEATSFADVAAAVGISRGNFYYHFKSKDEILEGVIALRVARTRAMLADWETQTGSPLARLRLFADILLRHRASIMQHGCPVGTLCAELAKLDHAALPRAGALFTHFSQWLAQQFVALGHGQESEALALHLLARTQGIATLASTFHDESFLAREVALLHDWLGTLTAPGKETA